MADNTEEMSEDDELLAAFVDESLELLQDLPSSLESYSADSSDTEQINAIFRAVHSIKGNAGFLGLGGIKQFAHSLENTLDEVRGGALVLSTGELISCARRFAGRAAA
jgi:two-component system, chemotaxis family, sensor kinase CheA